MYAIKLFYDHSGRDAVTYEKTDWLAAKHSFEDWKQNLGHAPEIKRVQMIVRGKVEADTKERPK